MNTPLNMSVTNNINSSDDAAGSPAVATGFLGGGFLRSGLLRSVTMGMAAALLLLTLPGCIVDSETGEDAPEVAIAGAELDHETGDDMAEAEALRHDEADDDREDTVGTNAKSSAPGGDNFAAVFEPDPVSWKPVPDEGTEANDR